MAHCSARAIRIWRCAKQGYPTSRAVREYNIQNLLLVFGSNTTGIVFEGGNIGNIYPLVGQDAGAL